MLNGRNCIKNDFTTVPSKGCSVVDYCIESHDQLSDFQDFIVVRASELINTFWRDIGKLGVAQSNNKQIPMEALDQDGNVNYY